MTRLVIPALCASPITHDTIICVHEKYTSSCARGKYLHKQPRSHHRVNDDRCQDDPLPIALSPVTVAIIALVKMVCVSFYCSTALKKIKGKRVLFTFLSLFLHLSFLVSCNRYKARPRPCQF
jgi:hypothetical protein